MNNQPNEKIESFGSMLWNHNPDFGIHRKIHQLCFHFLVVDDIFEILSVLESHENLGIMYKQESIYILDRNTKRR